MRIQILSDLHLETEAFEPQPAPGAELLVLAGDIDATWAGLERFAGWPCPVLLVAGNHEFDGRDLEQAWPALRNCCDRLGVRLLEREAHVLSDDRGRRLRFVGSTRWCDFDLFERSPGRHAAGAALSRTRVMRAASYFVKVMRASRGGRPFDPEGVREEALACRGWLEAELARAPAWDATVVITHFGPSLRSADPRYGAQPSTASFCNADDDLLPAADLWIHGHLHCRHDWVAEHPDGRRTRVICNARGHGHKGESADFDGRFTVEV